MSKFKIGDKVRDVSPHGPGLGHGAGTIVGREHDTWVIDWDATPHGRINWHDDQIEHLTPPGPVVTETVKRIVEWSGDGVTVSVHPDGKISIDVRMLTRKPERVKAAIAVLTQLADALEDK
jgi:hypothetical protein